METSGNENMGMITKIWGPAAWIFLHTVTFGYPINPSDEQKENYKKFFELIGDILPCSHCRKSYKEFIKMKESELNDGAMENRETFTKWFYNIHQKVNEKLDVDYGIMYEDMVKKYESFRAKCDRKIKENGCLTPLDYKAFSFRKLNIKDCPIIDHQIVDSFIKIAQFRGLNKCDLYEDVCNAGTLNSIKNTIKWDKRNKYCQKIITYMRENGIDSIEKEGEWKGYPTISELKLILNYCSNLSRSELIGILKNIYDKSPYLGSFIDISLFK